MGTPQQALTGTKDSNDLLLTLLEDLGEEVRKRRDPEYIYAAAALGSFGAVALGLASISAANPHLTLSGWLAPPSAVAAGIALIAFAVIFKIVQDHRAYVKLRKEQVRIVALLARNLAANSADLPEQYRQTGPGRGYLWSILIVAAAAFAAFAFCLSISLART